MKKGFVLLVLVVVFLNMCTVSFASSELNNSSIIVTAPKCLLGETVRIPVGDAEYLDVGNGKLIKISELPSISSQREADTFISNLRQALANPTQHNPTIDYTARSTHGNVKVASIIINGLKTLALWVEFTTSGDSNTGIVTYHNAYTTFTGFTLGIAWKQISCRSEVTSSGKDIYASASGEFAYYLLVDGLIELGREAVSLSGYCYAVY